MNDKACPRKEIMEFAQDMERKLRENDAVKNHWLDESTNHLLYSLKQEVTELSLEILFKFSSQAVIDECADVANLAMMIADHHRKLLDGTHDTASRERG